MSWIRNGHLLGEQHQHVVEPVPTGTPQPVLQIARHEQTIMPGARTATIKDLLLLRSGRFSFECPIEKGLQYDCPLGDDLAAFLKKTIEERDPSWRILGPIREDYGTELLCHQGRKCFRVTVNWTPLGGTGLRSDGEEVWVLRFRQAQGCLAALFRARDDHAGLAALQGLVAEIVKTEPAVFASSVWLTEQELIAMQRGARPRPPS